MSERVRLGYAVGSGEPVDVPLHHLVVTGQTQMAGKTTTLEALIARSELKAVAFVTKRGEASFASARTVRPYFRERADWQFVASILEASRGEKLKFERAWIIRASKGARSLADVQRNVRKAMETAKGMSADVYLTLDAYLDAVVPEIERVAWASSVVLSPGVNVMDLAALNVEMQHLVIRSTIDWVLNHESHTVVVVPEAWKFIPQGRGTPVKLAAESFIRQAAGLRNYLWLDSQDIAGVEKLILKSVPVWVLGVQRESNEIKRTLDQIPAGIKKPKPEAIATLGLGEFFACFGKDTTKVYVQPAWMSDDDAQARARGERVVIAQRTTTREDTVNEQQAQELRDENARLRARVAELEGWVAGRTETRQDSASGAVDEDALYRRIVDRLLREGPPHLRVATERPELTVEVERRQITANGSSLTGRIARLIAAGFFRETRRHTDIRNELQRTGSAVRGGNLSRDLGKLVVEGFLTDEGDGYREVTGMKVNIVEK